jgi:hypothetical protein
MVIGCGLLILLTVAYGLYAVIRHWTQVPERVIMRKVSRDQNDSAFTPILIYRIDENGRKEFAGSGSDFESPEGELIIASEHQFGKGLGNSTFVFRRLRPFETEITNGVNRILYRSAELGADWSSLPDVIVLKAGTARPIPCFSERLLSGIHEHTRLNAYKETRTVKSLVSGETVRVVGTFKTPLDGNAEYAVIEYHAVAGESGTGFVDGDDHLYVLKANLDVESHQRDIIRQVYHATKQLSFAYGPMRLRK